VGCFQKSKYFARPTSEATRVVTRTVTASDTRTHKNEDAAVPAPPRTAEVHEENRESKGSETDCKEKLSQSRSRDIGGVREHCARSCRDRRAGVQGNEPQTPRDNCPEIQTGEKSPGEYAVGK